MTYKIIIIILLSCFLIVGAAQAAGEQSFIQPLKDVHIKYTVVGWQTYDFSAATNLSSKEPLQYEWNIDGREMFFTTSLRYFFSKGEHMVKLRVLDRFGNVASDSVKLKIAFWSLQNNWFWWIIYLILAMLIVYYWIIKLIYLFNKKKISQQAQYFLDILDEHGWVEKMVKEHLKNAKQREIKTRNNVK